MNVRGLSPWAVLDAREVLKGGTLELWMGPQPNRSWGL